MTPSRRVGLLVAGATSGLPLMTFTVTGFSVVCLVGVGLMVAKLDRRDVALPLLLAGLGSLAYLLSSVVNDTSMLAINVPALPAVALYLCGLVVLADDLSEVCTVLAGVSVGTMIFYVSVGTVLTNDGLLADLWKYGLAAPATVLILWAFATSRLTSIWWACFSLMALAAVSIGLNSRSHAVICAASALLIGVDALRKRPLPMIAKAAMCAIGGLAASAVLKAAAAAGLLGAALTTKIELQSMQHVPAILAGRTEPPLSLTAILHSPILGWGSADNISPAVFDDAYQFAFKLGFDTAFPFGSFWRQPDGAVSLHSVVLGSWAEAGVLGVLLPLWLSWAAWNLVRLAHRHKRWAPLMTYLGIQSGWDLFFSPWSYNLPVVFAALAAIYIHLRRQERARDTDFPFVGEVPAWR